MIVDHIIFVSFPDTIIPWSKTKLNALIHWPIYDQQYILNIFVNVWPSCAHCKDLPHVKPLICDSSPFGRGHELFGTLMNNSYHRHANNHHQGGLGVQFLTSLAIFRHMFHFREVRRDTFWMLGSIYKTLRNRHSTFFKMCRTTIQWKLASKKSTQTDTVARSIAGPLNKKHI